MHAKVSLALVSVVFVAAMPAPRQSSPLQSHVLDQVQLPKGQGPDLGRPTRQDDSLPLFDFEKYFTGKWAFEWEIPDGPLGPAGTITGTTVYKRIDDTFYEADSDASGPAGPFKVHELIAYRKEAKTVARMVTDSRGFSYLQIASVGGDLGGSYNIYYDSVPFTYQGRTIRIRHGLHLVSPVNYKVAITVSVDGGKYLNYGSPWWQKQMTGSSR
jgi:hypothetical protein